jgi:tetratricopeptide (TPR) repeat protein
VGYLKLMFLPAGLTIAHYVETRYTLFALPLIISTLILLCFVINAIYLYTRKEVEWRLLSFFMLWYFVTLLIILVVPLNRVMQENRCYISGAGFALFTGIVLCKLVYSRHRINLAYGLLAILIILYGAGTVYRNTAWKNSVTIWTDAMEKTPFDPLTYNNLSVAYKDIKNYDMAKEVLNRGIMLFPNDRFLHYALGVAYKVTGDLELALSEFDRTMRITPHAASAFTGKGSVYLLRGEIDEAMRLFHEAIERKQGYAPAHYYMARALQMSGRLVDARKELDIALHYANISHDRNLAERINRYISDSTVENGVIEDLSIPTKKGDI